MKSCEKLIQRLELSPLLNLSHPIATQNNAKFTQVYIHTLAKLFKFKISIDFLLYKIDSSALLHASTS